MPSLSGWRLTFNVKRERRYVRVVKADFKLRGKSGVFNILDRQNWLFRYFAASLTECNRCKSGSSNTTEADLHISEDEESSSQKTRSFVRICENHTNLVFHSVIHFVFYDPDKSFLWIIPFTLPKQK